jgi:6-phosphogluconate dehydrogenase
MIVVDRIEGDIAVCEIDGTMVDVPLSKISGCVNEGDMLIDNGSGLYTIDTAATEQRKAEIIDLFESLKAKKKKPE